MKDNIMFPNYKNSILNLSVSILKKYGVESKHNSLPKLDNYLKQNYKNIVLIVLDGLGNNILNITTPYGILNKNKIDVITSVCPSTTAAAMPTYYSGKAPLEHGWLGWALYFKECQKYINVWEEYKKEKSEYENFNIKDVIKYKTIFEQIHEAMPKVNTYEILPENFVSHFASTTIRANGIQEMCNEIIANVNNSNEKFIFGYSYQPDNIIHRYGCKSDEVKNFMEDTDKKIQKLVDELQGTDTLLIISADHGHKDVEKVFGIDDIEGLDEYLERPPFIEPKFLSFFVKKDKLIEFEKTFNKNFKDKFILYSKREILEKNLLGYGNMHKKINDFIGDYVAISKCGSLIRLDALKNRELYNRISTHSGITREEMEVPLIIFKC